MGKKQSYSSPLDRLSMRRGKHYGRQIPPIILLSSMMLSLLSACGGDPPTEQQAKQSQIDLNRVIQYAQNIGVPDAQLKTIVTQAQTLNATYAPWSLFNDTAATTYYNNLSIRSTQLKIQTQGLIQVTTEQLKQQAQDELQRLQYTLSAKQNSGLPLAAISQLYDQNKARMQTAHYPKNFKAISDHTRDAITTITMMPDTMEKLQTLSQVISAMQTGHQDIPAVQKHYDEAKNAVVQATTPHDLQQVNQAIDAQNQQAMTNFTQVIPLLTQAKLDELSGNVQQLQQYGIDTSSYQKRLDADRALKLTVKTLQDYLTFAKQVDADQTAMHNDLLKGQVTTLIKQFYHIDSSGNVSANYGTPGCVNIPTDQAAWLYNNTTYNTQILMY